MVRVLDAHAIPGQHRLVWLAIFYLAAHHDSSPGTSLYIVIVKHCQASFPYLRGGDGVIASSEMLKVVAYKIAWATTLQLLQFQ